MKGAVSDPVEPHQDVILVAEDNDAAREGLCAVLRRRGYEAMGVANGASAIDTLKTYEIAAIVLDLHMPGSDGFQTLEYLQAHRRSLPVILLTGMAVEEIEAKMHRQKLVSLPPMFQKPVDIEQLLSVLEMLLEGSLKVS